MMNGPLPKGEGGASADDERARRWRTALAVLVLLLLLWLTLYGETALSMARVWARSDTFMHGFLVPPISLWLIWRERRVLAGMAPAPDARFALGVAACGFAWLLGQMAAVAPLAQFALIGALAFLVAALFGARIGRVVGFPLAFLLFAVPFGEFLMPRLMQWTADVTVLGLHFSGVPVYREDLRFVIPSGSWSVVEACSGVRYLIALSMLGTLFAYLTYRTAKRRLIFIVASLAAPIVANWLRAYLIVMLGHLSGNTLATGVDHLIYGWLFFGFILLLMFGIGARWREDGGPKLALDPELPPADAEAFRRRLIAAGLSCFALALPWLSFQQHIERNAKSAPVRLEVLAPIPGWTRGTDGEKRLPEWTPRFAAASAFLREAYAKEGGPAVGLFLGYYRNQDENRKLVSSDNALVKSSDRDWKRIAEGAAAASFRGTPLGVRTGELVSTAGERLLVWQWYWINGRRTSSDPLAKVYTALSRLVGKGDDSAVAIVYTTGENADAVLRDFVAAASPAIEEVLQRARDE
ncbi:MAG: exosortase A [Azoarcus sp.]|jgi:exosortase A|nr:exosortase A [Azoarcus sp.]